VPLAATQLFDAKFKERRRYQRVELSLSGRYMLRNHHEYPCWASPALQQRQMADFYSAPMAGFGYATMAGFCSAVDRCFV
jgi:hypothetical protein